MTRRIHGYLRLAVCVALGWGCAAESEPDTAPNATAGRSNVGGVSAGGSTLSNAGTTASGGSSANVAGTSAAAGKSSTGGTGSATAGTSASGGTGNAGTASGVSGSANGTAGAAGTATCPAAPIAPGTAPLIDDFNHLGRAIPMTEGRSGVWDVWSLLATADMSPKSANFQTTGVDSDGYTHWTGNSIGGTNDWGPTLTVQLSAGCPYDASAYAGISFRLKGTATKQSGASQVPLKVMLWQPPGVPAKDAKGGACTAQACYNHYSTFVNVPLTWDTAVNVPFASLTQGTWTGTTPFAWSAKQLLAIQFQVEVDGSKGELATFDLSLDDLSFAK